MVAFHSITFDKILKQASSISLRNKASSFNPSDSIQYFVYICLIGCWINVDVKKKLKGISHVQMLDPSLLTHIPSLFSLCFFFLFLLLVSSLIFFLSLNVTQQQYMAWFDSATFLCNEIHTRTIDFVYLNFNVIF